MAVRALLHYALEVPDQGTGEKFYTSFGLVNAPGRDNAVRLRPAPLERESVLLYGSELPAHVRLRPWFEQSRPGRSH